MHTIQMLSVSFWYRFLCGLVLFTLGLASGATIWGSYHKESCDNSLTLLNPEVRCQKSYTISKGEYNVVRGKISEYFESEKATGRLSRYSLYFRDLDNGPTMGINEKEGFLPASLLKLPLMITYLGLAMNEPAILEESYAFSGEQERLFEGYFKLEHIIKPNTPYTISELVFNMIAHSDNVSYLLLKQHLQDIEPKEDYLLGTFIELGIINSKGYLGESISAKSYASIFRTLYHASYLSSKFSQKALEILAAADFDEGLTKGVPRGLIVAHKFGERADLPDNKKELHDCGVVYYPNNPYVLCVMTEGRTIPELAQVIQTVSKIMYDEVDSRRI